MWNVKAKSRQGMAISVLKAPKCPLILRTHEEIKGKNVRKESVSPHIPRTFPAHSRRHPSQPDSALNGRLSGCRAAVGILQNSHLQSGLLRIPLTCVHLHRLFSLLQLTHLVELMIKMSRVCYTELWTLNVLHYDIHTSHRSLPM